MKARLRREAIRGRDALPPELRSEKDRLIEGRLFSLPEFLRAETVLLYASFKSEVATTNVIRESLRRGKRTVLPRVDKENHALETYEIRDAGELTPGYMGILEPVRSGDRFVDVNDLDLAVVPGAGFDNSGNRLGYGCGYYDILLAERRRSTTLVGIAYEEQILERIPADAHDVRMDVIITDLRVTRVP